MYEEFPLSLTRKDIPNIFNFFKPGDIFCCSNKTDKEPSKLEWLQLRNEKGDLFGMSGSYY